MRRGGGRIIVGLGNLWGMKGVEWEKEFRLDERK
jgi:hypothetical protein